MIAIQIACQTIAATCVQRSGSCAARASIAIGDDKGNKAAEIPASEFGLPIDFDELSEIIRAP